MVGLPGHPVAALFCTHLFVRALLARLEGRALRRRQITARLTEEVSANHGRAQYNGVFLREGPQGMERRRSGGNQGSSLPWPERTAISASPGTARASLGGARSW